MLSQLKKDQLLARKAKESVKAKILTILISDAEMVGKNDGNRETTESEIIALIKKYIKNLNEVLEVNDNEVTREEVSILEAYLPTQLSEDGIRGIVKNVIAELELSSPRDMGQVMKYFKQNHDGQFDGKVASQIAKEELSG